MNSLMLTLFINLSNRTELIGRPGFYLHNYYYTLLRLFLNAGNHLEG